MATRRPAPFVTAIADADRRSGGGKAASLAELVAAGLPVPDGFVLTTHAHRAARDGHQDTVRRALLGAYEALGRPAVAVRSSATVEDLEGASFAGQYVSVLDVIGDDMLARAVEEVWSSLTSTAATAYRRDRGIDETDMAMAVVVQPMVPAELGGVLFTRHPLTGAEDVVSASVAVGNGAGVVDGTASTETLEIDAATGRIRVRTADDGAAGIVGDHVAAALADVARRVRAAVGHRDVEFALTGDDVVLLQARPITGLADPGPRFEPEWADPADASRTWTLRSRAPLSRLEVDVHTALSQAMERGWAEAAQPFHAAHRGIQVQGWRYVTNAEEDEATARARAAHRDKLRTYQAAGTSLYEAEVEPLLLEHLAALRRAARRRSLPGLVDRLAQAIDSYALAMGDLHWRIQTRPVDWPAEYARLTGRPPTEANVLLQALDNRTSRLIRRLVALARTVQSDPVLVEVFEARRWAALDEPAVAGRPATGELQRGMRLLLAAHGLRTGMGMGGVADFRTPTWRMDPAVPLGMIASYARQDLDTLTATTRRLRRRRLRLERRLRREMADRAEAWLELEELRIHLVNASRTTEDHNHLMEQALGGSMREAVDAVGRALVAGGQLEHPDDVFHLAIGELRRLAAGESSPPSAGELVSARRREHARQAALRPPRTIGAPATEPPTNPATAAVEGSGLDGGLLRGLAASGGRARGPARVVPPGHEPPDVNPGEILVARLAGEAWTPIWPLLGGLVLDQGGIFQHAAVVAREYGVPAVMATREATTVITNGQMITVDGDLGVVELA